MKCNLCKKKKGKRACPVLGMLCPACCGQNHLDKIDCPLDCTFLSKMRKDLNDVYMQLCQKLTHFTFTENQAWCKGAVDKWLDEDRTVQPWEHTHFESYVDFGYRDSQGKRSLDIFMESASQSHRLNHQEIEALDCLSNAWVSVFEVISIEEGVGLEVEDLLDEKILFVYEKAGTFALQETEMIIAWVMQLKKTNVFCGALTPISLHIQDELIEYIFDKLDEADRHSVSFNDEHPVFARLLPRIFRKMRKLLQDRTPPKMFIENQEVRFCQAVYEVRDHKNAVHILTSHPNYESLGDQRYEYVEHRRGQKLPQPMDDSITIEMSALRLTLRALTQKGFENAKRALKKNFGNSLRYRYSSSNDFHEIKEKADVEMTHWLAHDPALNLSRNKKDFLTDQLNDFFPQVENDTNQRPPKDHENQRVNLEPIISETSAGQKSPQKTHRLPLVAHEAMKLHIPGIHGLIRRLVKHIRDDALLEDSATILDKEVARLKPVNEFLEQYALSLYSAHYSEEDALSDANILGSHICYLLNFELHKRKLFWVDASLSLMLQHTDLDITGDCFRLPFPACAFVYTDAATLEIGHSLLRHEDCGSRSGKVIKMITLYVIEGAKDNDAQGFHFFFLFDTGDDDWPYLASRDLFIHPDDNLDKILDSHFPTVSLDSLDPFFLAPELRKLLHVGINSILYSTSAHLDPIVLVPDVIRSQKHNKGTSSRKRVKKILKTGRSGEDVFFLPGKIDISRIKYIREIESMSDGYKIMKRFMVRGHWRKPNPSWKEQRLRWIEPYWKGPEMATIIEREYRLKE